jgi:ankyrin repeat protein
VLASTIGVSFALALTIPVPALAQFSKSYKFLEAVRKKDGQAVTDELNQPGSTMVNTHDITSGETALHIVTARRDAAWLGFLLAKGADPNARDGKGVTPLVLACNLGFTEGLEVLIAHGARVDEPSGTGETPLIAAVHRRDIQMIRTLLKAGANPDRADNSGRSARDYATLDGKDSPLLAEIVATAKTRRSSTATYGPKL